MSSIQDRTHEFKICVESIRTRSAVGNRGMEAKQRLLQNGRATTKSEFSRMASSIGKDINSTSLKLNKLGQLAKRKTLFDDRPVEISELTFIVKQDIAGINKQIAQLQAHAKQAEAKSASTSAEGKLIEEHNKNIIMMLQSKLAEVSMAFKDVLEIRTQNMKESKSRTEQFMYTAASSANQPTSMLYGAQRGGADPMGDGTSNKYDSKGKGRAVNDGDVLALDLDSAEEGAGNANGGAFMQMQLIEQQDTYIQQRSTAIESIESTIAELGQIFTQLAHMVAEQGERVQRIDADTQDIADNVRMGHNELLKYWGRISNDRWLMLKIFGVLIVFFLLFILVS